MALGTCTASACSNVKAQNATTPSAMSHFTHRLLQITVPANRCLTPVARL